MKVVITHRLGTMVGSRAATLECSFATLIHVSNLYLNPTHVCKGYLCKKWLKGQTSDGKGRIN